MLRTSFFTRAPLICARELIGAELRWGSCRGRIVETEAYASIGDEAAHSFFRPSARDFLARHPPGTAYVYLNYGVHWLFNVLVKGGGGAQDGFVLIRALEPTHGLAQMRRRRGRDAATSLCSGPGKLTVAMGIDGRLHGRDLCASPSHGFALSRRVAPAVWADLRIGITRSTELPWRFLAADSPHLSVPPSISAREV